MKIYIWIHKIFFFIKNVFFFLKKRRLLTWKLLSSKSYSRYLFKTDGNIDAKRKEQPIHAV